jgi:hypothetical protein
MSLDITFYGNNGEAPATIECTEEFYERLIHSDFAEIGISHKRKTEIEGEELEYDAIDLNKGTISHRQRLINFFNLEIVKQSRLMLNNLGESPSKQEYEQQSYPASYRKSCNI